MSDGPYDWDRDYIETNKEIDRLAKQAIAGEGAAQERDEAIEEIQSLKGEIASILGGLAMIQKVLETGEKNPYQAAELLQAILTTKEHLTT